jgi:hypothetical protein
MEDLLSVLHPLRSARPVEPAWWIWYLGLWKISINEMQEITTVAKTVAMQSSYLRPWRPLPCAARK